MNFAECVICLQVVMDFDALDYTQICRKDICQSKKKRVLSLATEKCSSCGYDFIHKDDNSSGMCERCIDERYNPVEDDTPVKPKKEKKDVNKSEAFQPIQTEMSFE